MASSGFPDVTFSGDVDYPVSWDGTNSHAYNEAQTTFTVQDNLLWTKGRHHFTFGFQWQALQDNENLPLTGSQAGFTFSTQETSNFPGTTTISPTQGSSYASYMLGMVDSATVTQNAVAETGGRYKTYAPYVQDNIQVTPKLTVNVGLRWDLWSPFTEVHNNMSFFNPNLANPAAGNILGALQFAGHGARQLRLQHSGTACITTISAPLWVCLQRRSQNRRQSLLRHLLRARRRRGRAQQTDARA